MSTATEKAPLATNDALDDLANIRARVRLLELALFPPRLGGALSGLVLAHRTAYAGVRSTPTQWIVRQFGKTRIDLWAQEQTFLRVEWPIVEFICGVSSR